MSLWSRFIRALFGRWLRNAADDEYPSENGDCEERG